MEKILALSVLAIALSVSYYCVIFLPKQERTRTALQVAALLRAEQQIEEAKQKAEEEKQEKQIEEFAFLSACLTIARKEYEDEWVKSCQSIEIRTAGGSQDCRSRIVENPCKEIQGAGNDIYCLLPSEVADRINHAWETFKDVCIDRFTSMS